jgi:hypothetical protein
MMGIWLRSEDCAKDYASGFRDAGCMALLPIFPLIACALAPKHSRVATVRGSEMTQSGCTIHGTGICRSFAMLIYRPPAR